MQASDLIALPSLAALERLTQSLAMLDAILSPEWELRYYSFNSKWGPGEKMASMRNGSGDDWFLHLSPAGGGFKGFAHESPAAAESSPLADRIRTEVPGELAAFRDEPAFRMDSVTFCAYRRTTDPRWVWITSGKPDGTSDLLGILDGNPRTYQKFAEDYYECEVPLDAVQAIYAHSPLTQRLIAQLNSALPLSSLQSDIEEIGYGLSS